MASELNMWYDALPYAIAYATALNARVYIMGSTYAPFTAIASSHLFTDECVSCMLYHCNCWIRRPFKLLTYTPRFYDLVDGRTRNVIRCSFQNQVTSVSRNRCWCSLTISNFFSMKVAPCTFLFRSFLFYFFGTPKIRTMERSTIARIENKEKKMRRQEILYLLYMRMKPDTLTPLRCCRVACTLLLSALCNMQCRVFTLP